MRWLLRGVCLVVVSPLVLAQLSIDRLVIVGDSLSDTGNVLNLAGGLLPPPPYFEGRFADGRIWHEYLADGLGIAPAIASSDGGSNYAYGAAEAAPGVQNIFGRVLPNTGGQIDRFLAGDAPRSSDLFGYWAGSNNMLENFADPSGTVAQVSDDLTRLANAGADQFLVINLPPLGEIPEATDYGTPSLLTQQAIEFNTLLSDELADLRAALHVTIIEIDVFSLIDQAIADPAQFGFTNVTEKALVNGIIVGDPTQYLFWDDLHPTTAAHALLADQILTIIPEPTGMLLLSLCLLWRRR